MAPKCAYCNAVTPKGRADAERAEQMARQQQAYAQHQAAAQASVNQALAAAEVNKFASYALFTTLPALVTCCAPAGWLGAFFAFRSLSVAKKNGIPAPARAIVAAVLAVLGTALTITAFVGAHFDEKDKEKRIAALDAKSAQNRKKATLDAKTACDTTEIHMLKSGTMYVSAKMVCTGEPVVTGATARLDGVSYVSNGKTEGPFRVCLAKGARWFVVHVDKSTDDCLDEAPKANDEQEEEVARSTYATLLEAARVNGTEKRLAGAKRAVERAETSAKTCTDAALAAAAPEPGSAGAPLVRAVDYDVLDGKADPGFSFLSDSDLRVYLAQKGTSKSRSELAAKISRGAPFLVVYKHTERSLPQVTDNGTKGDFGLTGGTYDGTLYVVDLGRSEVVCQGPLTWRIPTKPTFSLNKSSTKAQVGARAETDYRERFFDGATARIKALTNGKLRLGYKPLD